MAVYENKMIKYQQVTQAKDILTKIKKILTIKKNNNSEYISLFDVAKLLKKLRSNYNYLKKSYKIEFENIINSNLRNNDTFIQSLDFDYQNKLLKMGLKKGFWHNENLIITFAKDNDDLYIYEANTLMADDIFMALGKKISSFYDELLNYKDYTDNQEIYYLKDIDYNFDVEISREGCGVFYGNNKDLSKSDMILFSPSSELKYSLKTNSLLINKAIKNNEDELYKKIFVKIEECPFWIQDELKEIRDKQLLTSKVKKKVLNFFNK